MADSFGDLLQQLLPHLQGEAQQAAAASPFNPANITSPATAFPAATALSGGPAGILSALISPPLQAVSRVAGDLAQIPAGSLFGPLLAPPGNAPPIASAGPAQAAGYQVGRALGSLLAGQGLGGVGEVFGQGQQAWHEPEPIMGYKGVLEAPFNIFSYGGVPQGKAAGALAKAGVPGAAGLETVNRVLQSSVGKGIGGLEAGVGTAVGKLPWGLGAESVGSRVGAEQAGLQNVVSGTRAMAEQGLAPAAAQTQVFRSLAAQQAATAQAAAAPAAAAAGPTEGLAAQAMRAMGLAPETTPVGVWDQLAQQVVQPYIGRLHKDIDIAQTAYKQLGLDTSQPLAAVIGQADQVAPPILDAIPQAEAAWQAANPGAVLRNDAQFNDMLRAAEQTIGADTGQFVSEQQHWNTVLHWLQDTWPNFSPASQKPADVEALVLQRLAAERGRAPVHPAAQGMAPPAPEPAPSQAPGAAPAPEPGPPVPGAAPILSGATPRAAPPPADLYQRILAEEPGEAMRVLQQNRAAQGAPPVPEAGPPVPGAAPPLMEGAAPEAPPAAPTAPLRPGTPEWNAAVQAAEDAAFGGPREGVRLAAREAPATAPPAPGAAPGAPEDAALAAARARLQASPPVPSPVEQLPGLYSEMSPSNAAGLIQDEPMLRGLYASPSPDLALGQGANRGVTVEFGDLSRIWAEADRSKPANAAIEAQLGHAPEWVIEGTAPGTTDAVLRRLVIDPTRVADPRGTSILETRLQGAGWQRQVLPDGRIAWDNPRAAPPVPEPGPPVPGAAPVPTAPAAAPPMQWDASGTRIAREGVPLPPEPPPLGPSGAAGAPAESPAAGPPPTGTAAPAAAQPGEAPPAAAGAPTGSPAVGPPPGEPPSPPPGMPPDVAALFGPDQLARLPGVDADLARQAAAAMPALITKFDADKVRFQNIQNALAAVGDPPQTIRAAQTLLKTAQREGTLPPVQTKELDSTLKQLAPRYPIDSPLLDVATEDPALIRSYFYDRAQQLRAGSLAQKIPGAEGLLSAWDWAMNATRALGVASGMVPLKYAADAYLHRFGFAGDVSIPGMRTQVWNALKSGQEASVSPLAAEFYTDYGIGRPATIGRSAYAADIGTPLETAGTGTAGQSNWYRLRTYAKNAFDATSRTIADTVRESGFQTGYEQAMAQDAPAFATKLTDILGPEVGGPIGEQFTAAGGKVTPGALRDQMVAAGAAPDAMKEALYALTDLQQTAYDAGTALMDKMAPGAVRRTNLDEALRYAIPFSTFATRSMPRTMEFFATNPAIWNAFRAYHEITDAADKAEGRLPGTSLAQNVMLFKIGDTRFFINPLEYFVEDRPFRQPFTSPKQAPIIGEAYNRLSQQGLGLAGPLGLLLTSSGQLGPAPPPELTPVDALLANAASWASAQQLTTPWTAWANQRAGGKPAFAPLESVGGGAESFDPALEVRKRLGEMSLEETGRPDAPAYRAAMTNPADPLYQRAVREVNGRELVQEALHLVGMGVKLSPTSAGEISRGMAGIPQVNAAGPPLGNHLLPIMPYPNAAAVPAAGLPGGLMTNAQRQALLFQRALGGQPAAIGYSGAYAEGDATQPGGSSEYQARVDQIRKDFLGATPERQYAMWADPRTRGVVLDLMVTGKYSPTSRAATPSGTMQLP